MSSLADLPELVGFFSYSREDDAGAFGALSALRERIQHELRAQLGRTAKTFRIWQDKEAIPSGSLWESEIKNSVAQAVFFIPIITPTVVASPYCRVELDAFLAREAALGRSDLVFPVLYIQVPALEDSARREKDPVLSLIAKRQYVDWREFRHMDLNSTEVRRAIERFCGHIRDALNKTWLSPEARVANEQAVARQGAEDERELDETDARRQEEEARKREATFLERQRADNERQQREAEAEQRRVKEQGQRGDTEAKRRVAEEQRLAKKEERQREAGARPVWRTSWQVLAGGSLLAIVLAGAIGAWFALSSEPTPVSPTSHPPVTPVPAPVATQQSAIEPLSIAKEKALYPNDTFQECMNCPTLIVVPHGSFTMGSPTSEPGRMFAEGPQHTVIIARQFAVGQFEVTFDEWDACVADEGCNRYRPDDQGWGRGRRPVINVSWNDAKAYVAWLAKKTGKPYRLLSEAEYEYATRAGTTTVYPWGNAIGENNANCRDCGLFGAQQTAPVGSFAPNKFELYDMVGNVEAWTEDCFHVTYNGAPVDGSAWVTGDDCVNRAIRSGSFSALPDHLRSAHRIGNYTKTRSIYTGFRIARALSQ
ncbi:MAG TPA: SUMF1/EgtB/PvdO family nonheme iron enzyme [Terracidiphilus sp.]|jgi:formylglycine-generating enzyme required for sulfatase activity